MTAFLITMLVLHVIGLGCTSSNLQGNYPRTKSTSRSEDLIAMFIQIGMLVWTLTLLLDLP
ncbi:hypothetical protein [Phytopseudomonas daroniae]|uniref:hypothetical protein n=1 Tax=Phytopseudomonas daroniae TaxID=2487519 RepID=UPI0010383A00|nr:hypothetical protein [Pseudomonas daroniae]